ncbi:MAG TPA: hypothetical protein VFL57_15710 [Bryobacteraceae bacterium]|nr:hypothetical protein [Bryobacteraceae bacterium]
MRSTLVSVLAAMLLAAAARPNTAKTDPSAPEIDRIIRTFAENESAFRKARENYTYRQTAKLQEFDEAGAPRGKFEVVTDIVFDRLGNRREIVVRAPVPTLQLIQMTAEDEQDLRNIMPFVLTADEITNYHVRYLGRQRVDELDTYVFAVKPKAMQPGKRYFTGQIWIDDRDLMVVKTYGRSTGVLKKGFDQQFPKFETYREQVDGKYWFPTFTRADSTLYFEGSRPSVRMTVRYEDYKQFRAESKITVVDEEAPAKPAPPAAPPKKQ